MKISPYELLKPSKETRRIKEQEKNLNMVYPNSEPLYLNESVYRIDFNHIHRKEVLKEYRRLVNKIQYLIKTKYKDVSCVIVYSEHKHDTPYYMQTSKKGGKPHKVFTKLNSYKAIEHMHCLSYGKKCTGFLKDVCKQTPYRIQKQENNCLPLDYCLNQSTYNRQWNIG